MVLSTWRKAVLMLIALAWLPAETLAESKYDRRGATLTHDESSISLHFNRFLRGAETSHQNRSMRSRTLQGGQSQDRVTIFALFLFGSQNAAYSSWNISDMTTTMDDGNNNNPKSPPTILYTVAMGTYASTITDTTELLRLQPGHYYQFNISDASGSDSTGIDYTLVLSEPAFSLVSGQVLAGQTASTLIYVPSTEEAMGNITMPSAAPSMAPSIDCVARGGSCVIGSDCCSERCSPEEGLCYPGGDVADGLDRDKLTEGEGGAGG
jgi:hypothetical protein